MNKNWTASSALKAVIALAFVTAFTGGIFLLARGIKGAVLFMVVVIVVMAAVVYAIKQMGERESEKEEESQVHATVKEIVSEKGSAEKPSDGTAGARAVVALSSESAGSFSGMWLSVLENVIGDASVLIPSSLKELESLAADSQLIAIPSKESEALISGAGDIESLEALASEGRAVILEAASKRMVEMLGFRHSADSSQSRITWASPDVLGTDTAAIIEGFPGKIKIVCTEKTQGVFASMMICGGYPAIVSKRVGKGAVIALLFDYGEMAYSVKQAGKTGRGGFRHPYADLLDEFIISVAAKYIPLPRWHKHPEGADASAIVICDDDCSAKRTGIVLKLYGDIGVHPSFFMLAGNNLSVLNSMAADIPEAGLLLDLRGANLRTVAAGVTERLEKIEKAAQGGAMSTLKAVRFNIKCPDSLPREAAGLLEEAGVDADFTLGAGKSSGVYRHACGFPFRHIDDSGNPRGVLEFTHQFSDKASPPHPESLGDFVLDVKKSGGLFTVFIDPRDQIQSPAKRNSGLNLLKKAKAEGVHVCGAGEFIKWWKSRTRSAVKVSETVEGIKIVADTALDGMRLVLQDRLRGAKLLSVAVDGTQLEELPEENTIKLARGTHELLLKYSN